MKDDDPVKMDYQSILHNRARTEKKTEEAPPEVIELGRCVTVYPRGAKAIDVEVAGKNVASLQYHHITHLSEFAADGTWFWFIFGTEEKHKLLVKGRRIRDVFNRINDFCVRRIRAQDRKFDTDETQPFIWSAEVIPLPREG